MLEDAVQVAAATSPDPIQQAPKASSSISATLTAIETDAAPAAEKKAPEKLVPSASPQQTKGDEENQRAAKPQVRGVEHDRGKRWTAYYLGISLAVVGLVNLGPGVLEIADFFGYFESHTQHPVARWAYASLFVGGLQLCYAVYLIQLPDWSSVWVVALVTLLIASAYAMLLGVVWLGSDDGRLVELLELQGQIRSKATLWCLSMLSITSVLTYFCGREGIRWYKVHTLQATAVPSKP